MLVLYINRRLNYDIFNYAKKRLCKEKAKEISFVNIYKWSYGP